MEENPEKEGESLNGRRRWKEKKGKGGWAVCPRLCKQTVDNETEVDGRPTAPLMEQLKCGLTTRWLSHAMAPSNTHV